MKIHLNFTLLNPYNSKVNPLFAKTLDIIYGVVVDFTVGLKLKIKDRVTAIIATVNRKISRNNGIYTRLFSNVCVPLRILRRKLVNTIGDTVEVTTLYELHRKRLFKLLVDDFSRLY